MSETNRQFELRQLLKAYRKGLISDALFEEQLREIDSGVDATGETPADATAATEARSPEPPPRVWTCGSRQFDSERGMLVHFIDEFRAGEAFGAEAFALWAEVSTDPRLRGGLHAVREREDAHARLLAARLSDLGATPRAELPAQVRETARTKLRSREIRDADKVRDFLERLPEGKAAVQPILDVLAQIERDHETCALLEEILVDEVATLKGFEETATRLGVGRAAAAAVPAATNGRALAGDDAAGLRTGL